jgi:hypothetical protein
MAARFVRQWLFKALPFPLIVKAGFALARKRKAKSDLGNSRRWLSAGIVSPTVSRGAQVQLRCADQTVERQFRLPAEWA